MRTLAVVHHRHEEWISALREAEPRLESRGFHARAPFVDSWLTRAEGLFVWKVPERLIERMPRLTRSTGRGAIDKSQGPPPGASLP